MFHELRGSKPKEGFVMRVFVTGATGWIGSAVVRELIGSGHQVVGLARSDASSTVLREIGAEVQLGDLDDIESLREGTKAADGVVHLAFKQDFTDIAGSINTNLRSIETLANALTRHDSPLVVAFPTMGLTPGILATEDAAADRNSVGGLRVPLEEATIAMASRGVRTSVVRLAPSVHGRGDRGLVTQLIDIARKTGVSAYVDDGTNRWPTVHRLDAAHLFCLALEKASAGSRLHAVAEEGVPFRDIATVIGQHLNLPLVSMSYDDAAAHFGWLGPFVSNDNPTSSDLTRERLGWQPKHPGLIDDLEEGIYFSS